MKKLITIIFIFFTIVVSAKNYKGAEIYSTQSYLYGRFEMRIKSAPGSGQLSTFFLYRNNSEQNTTLWQEIDIEIFGKDTNCFQTNVIIERVEGTKLMSEEKHYTESSLSNNFHTYVLEWTPDSISWYFNDSLIRTEKEYAPECNAAMSIRFNHWASTSVGWVGAFDRTILPQFQYVDYISYSEYTPGEGEEGSDFTFSWRDDFSSFDNSRWAKANWTFDGNYCDFIPSNAYIEDDVLVLKLHDATPPPPVVIPTSLSENKNSIINVYPNPYQSLVTLDLKTNNEICVTVSNILGTVLFYRCGISKNNTKDVSDFLSVCDAGTYIMSFVDKDNLINERIIISKK